jgi:hypothetical protein
MRDTVYRKKAERHAVQILRKTVQFLLNQPVHLALVIDELRLGEAVSLRLSERFRGAVH